MEEEEEEEEEEGRSVSHPSLPGREERATRPRDDALMTKTGICDMAGGARRGGGGCGCCC